MHQLPISVTDIASKGGNYLLNAGPKSDGTFPPESADLLEGIGSWMKANHEAIYDTKASPLLPLTWGRCTKKENANTTTLYLSVFDWPKDSKLTIPGLKNEIISVTILAGNKKLESISTSDGIVINVPDRAPGEIASVIKLEVKG